MYGARFPCVWFGDVATHTCAGSLVLVFVSDRVLTLAKRHPKIAVKITRSLISLKRQRTTSIHLRRDPLSSMMASSPGMVLIR